MYTDSFTGEGSRRANEREQKKGPEKCFRGLMIVSAIVMSVLFLFGLMLLAALALKFVF